MPRCKVKGQTVCKPGSVHRTISHVWMVSGGWSFLWDAHCWTPRATHPDDSAEVRLGVAARAVPIRFCSRWGLPCQPCRQGRGALLPHPFTLTEIQQSQGVTGVGGLLSVALSLGSPPPGVTRHRTSVEPGLSSPMRVSPLHESDHPTVWPAGCRRSGLGKQPRSDARVSDQGAQGRDTVAVDAFTRAGRYPMPLERRQGRFGAVVPCFPMGAVFVP